MFYAVRALFDLRVRWARAYATRDRVMALYAPAAVLGLTTIALIAAARVGRWLKSPFRATLSKVKRGSNAMSSR